MVHCAPTREMCRGHTGDCRRGRAVATTRRLALRDDHPHRGHHATTPSRAASTWAGRGAPLARVISRPDASSTSVVGVRRTPRRRTRSRCSSASTSTWRHARDGRRHVGQDPSGRPARAHRRRRRTAAAWPARRAPRRTPSRPARWSRLRPTLASGRPGATSAFAVERSRDHPRAPGASRGTGRRTARARRRTRARRRRRPAAPTDRGPCRPQPTRDRVSFRA